MALERSQGSDASGSEITLAKRTSVSRHSYIRIIEFDEASIAGGMASDKKRAHRSTAKASCGGGKAVDVIQSGSGGIMAYCASCSSTVYWNPMLKEWGEG